MRMQGYCDVYKWTILKRTSPEVKCLHPTSSRREMCTLSVSDVIYHKFSHGAAFYTLNGKNVNVMLEFFLQSVNVHQIKDGRNGVVNNQIQDWSFRLDGIFHNSTQDQVFDTVASSIVTQALDGYNGEF